MPCDEIHDPLVGTCWRVNRTSGEFKVVAVDGEFAIVLDTRRVPRRIFVASLREPASARHTRISGWTS